jgi:hypothetical protein
MDAFLVLGHGVENPIEFEERKKIPDGITLVTLAECGLTTSIEEVCPGLQAFTNPDFRDIILNPKKNKAIIESFLKKKIHVYEKDKPYPDLSVQLYTDWSDDESVEVFKSGLYKFPIAIDDIQIGEGATLCEKAFSSFAPYNGYLKEMPDDFDPKPMYKGSIFPKLTDIEAKLSETKRSDVFKKSFTYSLENLFEEGGAGVYYFVVCRAPKNIKQPKNVVEGILQPLNNTPWREYYTHNWISKLNTLLPKLQAERNKRPEGRWNRGEIENVIRNYTNLQRVPRIRAMSMSQQEGGKPLRKTRKQKKKARKTRKQRL